MLLRNTLDLWCISEYRWKERPREKIQIWGCFQVMHGSKTFITFPLFGGCASQLQFPALHKNDAQLDTLGNTVYPLTLQKIFTLRNQEKTTAQETKKLQNNCALITVTFFLLSRHPYQKAQSASYQHRRVRTIRRICRETTPSCNLHSQWKHTTENEHQPLCQAV